MPSFMKVSKFAQFHLKTELFPLTIEPEQAFSISMPQPVFEILIAYKKKHVAYVFHDKNMIKEN